MNSSQIPCRLPKSGKVTSVMIMFHGYGANGKDLIDLSNYFFKFFPEMAFYAPNGCEDFENYPGLGYQWFPLPSLDPVVLRSGLQKTEKQVVSIINEIMDHHGLNYNQVFIFGFSQGALVALNMIYNLPKIAGILGYSGAFMARQEEKILSYDTPILLVHGAQDTVVPIMYHNLAHAELTDLGFNARGPVITYLDHGINEDALIEGKKFMKNILDMQRAKTKESNAMKTNETDIKNTAT